MVFYAYDTGTGQVVDLVDGLQGTNSSAFKPTPSPQGSGNRYTSGGPFVAFPNTSNIVGIFPSSLYSFATAWNITALPSVAFTGAFCVSDTATNTATGLQWDSGATNNMVAIYANTNTSTFTANSVGVYHSVVGTNTSATSQNTYFDGKLAVTSAITAAFTATAYQPVLNSEQSNFPTGNGVAGWIYFAALWNRTITAAEARQLHDDPYCFLIYPEDEIFASLVGVTAAPTTAWVPQSDNNALIAASARSKVSAIALAAGAVWVPVAPATPPNSKPAGWYQPLSIPLPAVRAQPGSSYVPFNTPQVATSVPGGWQSIPSAAPAVAKVNAPNLPFIVPPFVVPSGWQSTSAIVPPVARPQLGSAFVPFNTLQLNTAPLGWYQPLGTTPTAPPAQPGSAILSYNITQAINTITGMGWFQALAVTPQGPPSQIGATFVPFDTPQTTPAISPYGWYQPLSIAPLVAQAIYTQPIWVPAPFPTFTLAWQQSLAPTPSSPSTQFGSTSLSYNIQPLANTVIGMPWQQPLSTPMPVAVVYQSQFFVPYDTAQIIVTTTLIQRTLTGVGL